MTRSQLKFFLGFSCVALRAYIQFERIYSISIMAVPNSHPSTLLNNPSRPTCPIELIRNYHTNAGQHLSTPLPCASNFLNQNNISFQPAQHYDPHYSHSQYYYPPASPESPPTTLATCTSNIVSSISTTMTAPKTSLPSVSHISILSGRSDFNVWNNGVRSLITYLVMLAILQISQLLVPPRVRVVSLLIHLFSRLHLQQLN